MLTPCDGEQFYDHVGRNVVKSDKKMSNYARFRKNGFGWKMQHLAATFLSKPHPRATRWVSLLLSRPVTGLASHERSVLIPSRYATGHNAIYLLLKLVGCMFLTRELV
uniref:Uncharacterized protein n=1 Tax=Helianthus annuus TaxID=4232 RepID=A0A251UQN0_HELAN